MYHFIAVDQNAYWFINNTWERVKERVREGDERKKTREMRETERERENGGDRK